MPTPDLPLQTGTSPGEIAERELVPGTRTSPPARDREENELPRDRDPGPPPESKSEE